jgi:hypothetical protein
MRNKNSPKIIKSDYLFLAALTVLWAAFHFRPLFLGHTFVLMDCSRFFYPLWKWGSQVIQHGVVPLWNPDAGFGMPYLADPQTAVWYPPKALLYLLVNPTGAFTILILLHHLFILAGFWFWARGRNFSRPASLLGCMAFGFSFNCICLTWAPIMLLTFSWVPWVFWAADRMWERKTAGNFLLFSMTVAMQMNAGYPIFAYLTLFVLGTEWFLKAWAGAKRNRWREISVRMAWLAPVLVLAVLFSLVWILPFLELSPYTNIGRRLEMTSAMGWGNLATWLNPFYLGHPLYSHPPVPHSVSVYFVGLPLAVLVLWGLIRRKTHWTSRVLFGLALVLSLGENAGLGGWLKAFFPGYAWVARSGYWIPFVLFLTVRVAMEAADKTILKKNEKNPSKVLWFALCLIVFGAALLLGVPWDLPGFWVSLILLILAGPGKGIPVSMRWVFCVAALVFSLAPVVRSFHFTLEKSYYDQKAEICGKLAQPGRIYQSPGFVDRYQAVSGKNVREAYSKIKEALIPNWPLAYGLEETCFSGAVFLNSFLRWNDLPARMGPENRDKLLQYLNARYVLERPETGDVSSRFLETPAILPKWFSVAKAEAAGNWDSDLERFCKPDFNFSKLCLTEEGAQGGDYLPRVVHQEERTPNRIRLFIEGKGKAMLVSSEMAFPGWVARTGVNFRSLLVVNHDFRGLILQPEEKRAEVVYRPTSFRLGMFLSLLAIATWFGMAACLLRRPGKGF